jgi:hypothetical protein
MGPSHYKCFPSYAYVDFMYLSYLIQFLIQRSGFIASTLDHSRTARMAWLGESIYIFAAVRVRT